MPRHSSSSGAFIPACTTAARLLTKMTSKRVSESQRPPRATHGARHTSLPNSLFSALQCAGRNRPHNHEPHKQLQKDPRANGIEGLC
jgi:hypothetical protein